MTDTTTSHHPAAVATATWWSDRVFAGDAGSSGDGMIDALAILAGQQGRPADASKRDQFVDALATQVAAQLERDPDDRYGATLSVDYGPKGALADVGRQLGVAGFPWKTVTWTHRTHVTASWGYGAAQVLVWQSPDWERPECRTLQYDHDEDGQLTRRPWRCGRPIYHDGDHEYSIPEELCAGQLRGAPCLRPAGDDYHDMNDPWSSSHHPFVSAAAVAR